MGLMVPPILSHLNQTNSWGTRTKMIQLHRACYSEGTTADQRYLDACSFRSVCACVCACARVCVRVRVCFSFSEWWWNNS